MAPLARLVLVCLAMLGAQVAQGSGDGWCEHGTCDDSFDGESETAAPPPSARPPHSGHESVSFCSVKEGDLDFTFIKAGWSQAKWKDDSAGDCWCFPSEPVGNVWTWGKTRVVHLDNYDPGRMHLWVGIDEDSLRVNMKGDDNDSWLSFATRYIPGMLTHSCSPFGSQRTCTVRSSPFEKICVGVKAQPQYPARLMVMQDYQAATLVPLFVASALFILAPLAAHSLWCYYCTASILMAVCCIGVVAFFSIRRVLGSKQVVFLRLAPCTLFRRSGASLMLTLMLQWCCYTCCPLWLRQAVVFGLLSWGGAVHQSFVHNLLVNKWAMVFVSTCALSRALPPCQPLQH